MITIPRKLVNSDIAEVDRANTAKPRAGSPNVRESQILHRTVRYRSLVMESPFQLYRVHTAEGADRCAVAGCSASPLFDYRNTSYSTAGPVRRAGATFRLKLTWARGQPMCSFAGFERSTTGRSVRRWSPSGSMMTRVRSVMDTPSTGLGRFVFSMVSADFAIPCSLRDSPDSHRVTTGICEPDCPARFKMRRAP
jgi:hypothetical protein